MRIGIDYRPALDGRTGIAVYVRELVAALRTQDPDDELELLGHRLRAAATPAAVPAGARLRRRRIPAPMLQLAARVGWGTDRLLGDVDVLHATDYVALRATRAPLVATVHDVCFHTVPDCYEPTLRRRLARVTDDLVRRAARVIVPSKRVRAELLAHTPARAERVRVVPHGPPGLPAARAEPGVVPEGDYILCVATVQPRKNLARLLDAFEQLRAARSALRLVVAGPAGWGSGAVQARLRATPGVHWHPDLDRPAIAALLRDARVVAYPSLGEGFGFPVLEAWQARVPLLVGADTAAADLAGPGALAVDPYDPDAIAAGLATLLEDAPRAHDLVQAGAAALASYDWARTAAATRAVYAEALAP